MDKLTALSEVKSLIASGNLKYSEYDLIQNVVMKDDTNTDSINTARAKLYELVDNNLITAEVFETLKESLIIKPTPATPSGVQSTPTVGSSSTSDKPIRGKVLGFVLGFFLGIIGLILGIILGDDDCKKFTIIGFVVSLVLGVVLGVIIGLSGIAAAGLAL